MHIQPCNSGSVCAAKESFGGMRLLRRADFNAGAHINTFWRMPCRGSLDAGSKKSLTWDNKHITWFGKWPGFPSHMSNSIIWPLLAVVIRLVYTDHEESAS